MQDVEEIQEVLTQRVMQKTEDTKEDSDQEAADKVAKLIDDIYVQERTDKTDEQCKEAKEAWDALTDAQKRISRR